MYEIEAKVPVTRGDIDRLRKEISAFATLKGKSVKRDAYYGHAKGFYLRIREKKGKPAILGIKSKNVVDGMEMNQEIEFALNSRPKFHRLLESMGIRFWTHKEKRSEVYTHGALQLELNLIPGLGHYLEIESIAKNKQGIPAAKKALHTMFAKLGFSAKQFEKKYYLELLENKHKQVPLE